MNSVILQKNALQIIRGESKTLRLAVTQDAQRSTPVDLTGSVIYFTVKKREVDKDPVIQKTSTNPVQIEITNARGGVAQIYLTPADTHNMDIDDYLYDVWVHFTATGKRFPVVQTSTLRLVPGVSVIPF